MESLREWKVWRDLVMLPEGKILMPGVVDHTTNVVEHPEVIADRIITYANVVGRENVSSMGLWSARLQ
jgi:5-methyltetrahydropteroyltriglutamate--homocysteine methyltransferase